MKKLSVFCSLLFLVNFAIGADFLSDGKGSINFRYRFEQVDQTEIAEQAYASTLRTRLNYASGQDSDVAFFVEMDDVSYVGDDDFNSFRNGRTTYPVVADPDGTGINQMYVDLNADAVKVRLGRQRINLDNQRFVGGVGWRQNEQTYDGLTVKTSGNDNFDFSYSFISNVARIFGPDDGAPTDAFKSKTHLANLALKPGDLGKIVIYGYFMDFDNAPGASNQTIGVRYTTTIKSDAVSVPLTLEFATQDDHGDNPTGYSANYYLAEAAFKLDAVQLVAGLEVLEGDTSAGKAFQTPLATLHKFQGWTDKFLGTPASGVEDLFLGIRYKTGAHNLGFTWHDLSAESTSADHGTEWDLSWAFKVNEHYNLLFKYGSYDADTLSTDTTKAWLMLTASF